MKVIRINTKNWTFHLYLKKFVQKQDSLAGFTYRIIVLPVLALSSPEEISSSKKEAKRHVFYIPQHGTVGLRKPFYEH